MSTPPLVLLRSEALLAQLASGYTVITLTSSWKAYLYTNLGRPAKYIPSLLSLAQSFKLGLVIALPHSFEAY